MSGTFAAAIILRRKTVDRFVLSFFSSLHHPGRLSLFPFSFLPQGRLLFLSWRLSSGYRLIPDPDGNCPDYFFSSVLRSPPHLPRAAPVPQTVLTPSYPVSTKRFPRAPGLFYFQPISPFPPGFLFHKSSPWPVTPRTHRRSFFLILPGLFPLPPFLGLSFGRLASCGWRMACRLPHLYVIQDDSPPSGNAHFMSATNFGIDHVARNKLPILPLPSFPFLSRRSVPSLFSHLSLFSKVVV